MGKIEMTETLSVDAGMMAAVDGCLPGRQIGDVFPAALICFASKPLALVPPDRASPVMHRKKDKSVHSVVALCLHHGQEITVFDFAVSAYCGRTHVSEDYQPGQLYRGDINLSFAPLTKFDVSIKRSGAPPLVYDWKIERIEAPEPSDGQWRDFSQIPRKRDLTSPIVLHCTALSDAPRHTLKP